MNDFDHIRGVLDRDRWGNPDLEQVKTRGRRRRQQNRAARAGAMAAVILSGSLFVPALVEREGQLSTATDQHERNGPPEGKLLLQVNSQAQILDSSGGRDVLATGIDAFEFASADEVIATTYSYDDAAGHAVRRSLLRVSVASKERTPVVRAAKGGAIDDPAVAPAARKVAYTFVSGAPSVERLCITGLESPAPRCLNRPTELHSYSWSPDGLSLVAAGDGDSPVYLIESTALSARVLMPAGGSPSIREAIAAAGHGVPLQFVSLTWNSTGELLAGVVMTSEGGAVPTVFDTAGQFVAMGQANADLPSVAWSPVRDELAYSTGVLGIPLEGSEPGVHLLDVANGQSRELLETGDHPVPWVFDLDWSPSGEWLAVSHESTVGFLRPGDAQSWYEVEVPGVDPRNGVGTLRDWRVD